MIDVLLEDLSSGSTGSVISVFKTIRALRLFKLAKRSKELMIMINAIRSTLLDMVYMCLIFGLYIFICALLGMEFFAYNVTVDGLD